MPLIKFPEYGSHGFLFCVLQYLQQVGNSATSVEKDTTDGCLQLLAHIFAIHVAHLTTGHYPPLHFVSFDMHSNLSMGIFVDSSET